MTGKLSPDDWDKVTLASTALAHTKIYIDDNPSLSVADMNAKCRRIEDLGMVVIDYLQLMQSSGSTTRYAGENRQQVVADISRALKIMAKELHVPVLCLSQLSRANEARSDKRPMLSDLRESGAIEQDADIVMFLYRDDYYNKDSDKRNLAECIIAKNRRGDHHHPPSSGCRNSLPSPLWSVIMKNPIDLAAQAAAFADKYNMLPQGSTVLCALSGGADSMALLSRAGGPGQTGGPSPSTPPTSTISCGGGVPTGRGLRGPVVPEAGHPPGGGPGRRGPGGPGTGQRGGGNRPRHALRLFTATAQELGADKIATAHNADDNAETPPAPPGPGHRIGWTDRDSPGTRHFDPSPAGHPRIDIAVYLAQEEIPHVEDSSNQDTVYARNRLRQEVMPVLRDLNPAFVSTLAANLVHLREDRGPSPRHGGKGHQDRGGVRGGVSLSARTLAALPHPVAVRAVKQLLAKVDRFQISSVHLEQILSLAAGLSPSATLNLPDDLFVWREYDQLVLCPSSAMPLAFSLRLLTGPGTFALDNGWKIEITETICPDLPAQEEYGGTLPRTP